jgi:hypothetical protein
MHLLLCLRLLVLLPPHLQYYKQCTTKPMYMLHL